MDQDGIPDICDSDIDGDGYTNLIGIVTKDNPDCELSEDNIDKDRLQEQTGICKKWNDIGDSKWDNCFFQQNNQQIDQDNDGIWSSCDSDDQTPDDNDVWDDDNDKDSDWFPNDTDECPSVPGSIWGCPDLTAWNSTAWNASAWNTWWDNNDEPIENPLQVDTCTECPCPFVDYASEILPGDRIRAVLTDPGGERVYSISDPRIIRE